MLYSYAPVYHWGPEFENLCVIHQNLAKLFEKQKECGSQAHTNEHKSNLPSELTIVLRTHVFYRGAL